EVNDRLRTRDGTPRVASPSTACLRVLRFLRVFVVAGLTLTFDACYIRAFMPVWKSLLRRGLCLASLAVCLTVAPRDPGLAAQTAAVPSGETRALWVLRTSLTTPESIATLVRSAREHGFNTLLVQVRGRGDAWFHGGVEPRPAELLRQPEAFDPLASVLDAAHAAHLRVHAWVNVNL